MDLVNTKFHAVKQFIPVDCPVTPGLTPKFMEELTEGPEIQSLENQCCWWSTSLSTED